MSFQSLALYPSSSASQICGGAQEVSSFDAEICQVKLDFSLRERTLKDLTELA